MNQKSSETQTLNSFRQALTSDSQKGFFEGRLVGDVTLFDGCVAIDLDLNLLGAEIVGIEFLFQRFCRWRLIIAYAQFLSSVLDERDQSHSKLRP
jgi:hypothetical protein